MLYICLLLISMENTELLVLCTCAGQLQVSAGETRAHPPGFTSPLSRIAALLKYQGQALRKNRDAALGSGFVEKTGPGLGVRCGHA